MLTHLLELIAVLGIVGVVFLVTFYPMMKSSLGRTRRFPQLDQEYEPVTASEIIERIRLQRSFLSAGAAMMLSALWFRYPYNWLAACTFGPLVFGVVHALVTKHDKLDRFLSPPKMDPDYLMKNQFSRNAQEVISRFPSSEYISEDQFIKELVEYAKYTGTELKSIVDVTSIDVGYVSKVTLKNGERTVTTYAIGGNTPYLIIQNLVPLNRAEALVVYVDELENWMRNGSLEGIHSFGMPRITPLGDWSEIPYHSDNRYVFNTRREYIRFSVLNRLSHECTQESVLKLMRKNSIEPRAEFLDIPPKVVNLDMKGQESNSSV